MKYYVIKCIDFHERYTYYVGNGSYRVNKERYAVITETESQAKRYKSKAIAKNAYEKLFESCVNLTLEYEIIEVTENEK